MHCGGGVMGGTGCESCFSIHPHFSVTLHGNTGPLSLASTKTLPPGFHDTSGISSYQRAPRANRAASVCPLPLLSI